MEKSRANYNNLENTNKLQEFINKLVLCIVAYYALFKEEYFGYIEIEKLPLSKDIDNLEQLINVLKICKNNCLNPYHWNDEDLWKARFYTYFKELVNYLLNPDQVYTSSNASDLIEIIQYAIEIKNNSGQNTNFKSVNLELTSAKYFDLLKRLADLKADSQKLEKLYNKQ